MSEIKIKKEALEDLLLSLDAEAIDFIKSVINAPIELTVPQNFRFETLTAGWEGTTPHHFELELILG